MAKESFKEDSLRDYKFQSWLVEKQVMGRRSVMEEDLELTHKEIRGEHFGEKMLYHLHQRTGYLVSPEEIGLNVYGETNEDNSARVNALGFDLKNRKLADPTVIFHAKELGWGVGVTDLAVTANSYQILYRLWLDLPDWVDEREIAQSVYGTTHPSDIDSVRRQTLKLRHKELPKTQAKLEMDQVRGENRHNYRLLGKEKDYTRAELTPPYLGLEFQNWLAHPQIGLIKRSHKNLPQARTGEQTRKDMQLLALLNEYNGFIVPYSLLSYLVYNSEDEITKLRETFSNLKDRGYIDPQSTYVFPEVGLGYGIRDVLLTQNQMRLMHALWEERVDGAPIPNILLAREIYGLASERFEENIQSLVSKTRKALASANANYLIETVKDNKRLAYKLSPRRKK